MEIFHHLHITIAFIIDLLIGDPEFPYHPVRLMGKAISRLEERFRKLSEDQNSNGFLFALFMVAVVYIISKLLIFGAASLDSFFNISMIESLVIIILLYYGLSTRDLGDKALEVYKALKDKDIDKARSKVSMMVGRDTMGLNEKEITRACIESVAESITDGIISPLFYAFLGGAPMMMAFKAVSTLDSMIGYKNEKYRDFGYACAKLDDVANLIPARIAGLLIPVAASIHRQNGKLSRKIMKRDGRKNPSPNSGISQAAISGALEIQLGGTNYYNGEKSEKPVIGEKIKSINPDHIKDSVRIAYYTGILFLIIILVIGLGFRYYFFN